MARLWLAWSRFRVLSISSCRNTELHQSEVSRGSRDQLQPITAHLKAYGMTRIMMRRPTKRMMRVGRMAFTS